MKRVLSLLGICLLLLLAGGLLYAYAAPEVPPALVQVVETPSPTPTASRTPSPSRTPSAVTRATSSASPQAASPTSTLTALPTESPSPSPTAGPHYMRFHTLREVLLFQGPGTYYARQGTAAPESALLVAGRTADGLWWMVCCTEGKSGWLRYDPALLRAEGDITLVAIMSVPPTPTLPPAVAPTSPPVAVAPGRAAPAVTPTLPGNPACQIPGASYASIPVVGPSSTRPGAQDPEFNLLLRGYERTESYLELMGYLGDTDPDAPQLYMLFADNRTPVFRALYRVRDWNWGCNCPGLPINEPEVTLVSMVTTQGEVLRVPDRSGGDIGHGYKVMVLHASEARITLKYTREDSVLSGYTIHIENVCVDPRLLALYQQLEREGRRSLPALYGGQSIGLALTEEIKVAIRDTGAFMDPRSRKDWWMGR